MARNVLVRLVPRIDHTAMNRMERAVAGGISGGAKKGFDGAKGYLIAGFAGLAATLGNDIAVAVRKVVDEAEGHLKRLRIETGKAITQTERDELGSVLTGAGVSETAAIEGISGLRRFKEITDPAERESMATFAARLHEAGVSVDAFNKWIRRQYSGDISASEYTALADLAYSIPTAVGSEPGSVFGAVNASGPLLGSLGLSPVEQLQFASSVDISGFDVSNFDSTLARGVTRAGDKGIDPASWFKTSAEMIRGAESFEEAMRIGKRAFGVGIQPAGLQRTVDYIHSGGYTGGAFGAPDASIGNVYGTEEDRIEAALSSMGIRGDSRERLESGLYDTYTSGMMSFLTGSITTEAARAQIGETPGEGPGLLGQVFSGLGTIIPGKDPFEVGSNVGRQAIGSKFELGDRSAWEVADQAIVEDADKVRKLLSDNAAALEGAMRKYASAADTLTNIVEKLAKSSPPTARTVENLGELFLEGTKSASGFSESLQDMVDAGSLTRDQARLLRDGLIQQKAAVDAANASVDAGTLGLTAYKESVRDLGLEFATLQGLAPEDQLQEIAAWFDAISNPNPREIGHYLNLLTDFVNQPEVQSNIAEAVAESLFELGTALDETDYADRLAVLSGQLESWADNVHTTLDFSAHQQVLADIHKLLNDPLGEGLGTPAASLPNQGGGGEEPEGPFAAFARIKQTWADIVGYVKDFGIEVEETTKPNMEAVETVISNTKENMGYMLADLGTLGGTAEEATEQAGPLWDALTTANANAKAIRDHLEAINGETYKVTVQVAYEADPVYGVPDAGSAGLIGGNNAAEEDNRRQESAATEDTRRSVEPDYGSGDFGP